MVPNSLQEWTYAAIEALCVTGQTESERHDFKLNLPDAAGLTKLCCAFANTYGGFVVLGVKDQNRSGFDVIGLDPDKEIYGRFVAKVRADPELTLSPPSAVAIPGSAKLLYVFEILQSSRRPHLPTPADERLFWKRQGSSCAQMTLEEIRYQMNIYEEKREKLMLLLIDLSHKLGSVDDQVKMPAGNYNGDVYSFDIIDRAIVEAYSIIKVDVNIITALNTIKRRLMTLNAAKEKMLQMLAMDYPFPTKTKFMEEFRVAAVTIQPELTGLVGQIERTLQERFGIFNPYRESR